MITNATDNLTNEQTDSDPSTLRAWIDDVEQRVSRTHPDWILMTSHGVVLLRNNKTGVSSAAHAEALLNNLPPHGWSNPIPAFPSTIGDVLPDNLDLTHAFADLAITQVRKALGLYILSGFKYERPSARTSRQ